MLVDDALLTREGDHWVASSDLSELPVPSTIHALLAARLEGLPADERAILMTAAVEGAVFHRGAVGELRPTLDTPLEDGLLALVSRDLIRPDTRGLRRRKGLPLPPWPDPRRRLSLAAEERAGRSARALRRLARAERPGTGCANSRRSSATTWSRPSGTASHSDRSTRAPPRSPPRRPSGSRRRDGGRSSAATCPRRSACSSGFPGCSPPTIHDGSALLAELGAALIECGRLAEAGRVLDEGERLAAAADDERAASHVLVQQQFLRLLHGEEGGLEEAARATALVIPVFERCGDDLGLCRARRLEAWLFWNEARAEAAAAAWERAAAHARRAGDRHEYYEILTWIASSLWFGPTPAAEGIRRCEAMREEVRESPESEAAILRQLACLNAIVGRFALARELLATSNAAYADLGLTLYAATSEHEAVVELLAGNPAAAEKSARAAYRALEEMGERAFRSTMAASLAWAILEQGRDEEAEAFAELSARLAASGDLLTQVLWRRVRARVLARRAEIQAAEALAREAVAIAEATDFVNDRADALIDLSHVLEASRRGDEAVAAASGALHLYELKGNVVAAAATRLRLGKLVKI